MYFLNAIIMYVMAYYFKAVNIYQITSNLFSFKYVQYQ